MATRDTAIGAFVAGVSPLAASTSNDAAGGKIGYARSIVNSASTTTIVGDVIHVANVPVNTAREIDIVVCGTFRTDIPAGVQVRIIEDGVMLLRRNFRSVGAVTTGNTSTDHSFCVRISSQPTAGNHTYTIAFGISGSGGTAILIADADSPLTLDIYDVGPAFV